MTFPIPWVQPRQDVRYGLTDLDSSTVDQNSYSFASKAIGTAQDKLVLVAYCFTNLTGQGISSVNIGGSAATTVHATGTNTACGLAYRRMGSATTATIEINPTSTGSSRCGIRVYAIYGLGSFTAVATSTPAGGASTSRAGSLNVSAGGILFAVSANQEGATSWSGGVTEDFDDQIESAMGFSGASILSASAITPAGPTSSAARCIAAASFR